MLLFFCLFYFFFFNDTATTEIYTLSLHDALPISIGLICRRSCAGVRAFLRRLRRSCGSHVAPPFFGPGSCDGTRVKRDRKSTRLNSSHLVISYAVFCLKKKKKKKK